MKLKAIRKHFVKAPCPECGAAMSIDVIRVTEFKCKKGHVSSVADVTDELTFKVANRQRVLLDLPPLPGKSDRSGFKRPKGELAKMLTNRARVLVEKLGKSEAKRHAGKMLDSAVNSDNPAQIEFQQGLIAEIEAL